MKKGILLKNNKGTTLTELLISMTIGLILLAACLEIFILIKKNALMQQGLSRIQENARIFDILLGRAVRSSGNMGCVSFEKETFIKIHHDIDAVKLGLDPLIRIEGISHDQFKKNSFISSHSIHRLSQKGDILWIKSTHEHYPLSLPVNPNDSYLIVKGYPKIASNQAIILSDCRSAEILKVDNQHGTSHGNKIKLKSFKENDRLSQFYKSGEVGLLSSTIYFLGDTYRKNGNHHPIYSLYATDLNGRTLELVEGVEQFRVFYGIKNGNVMNYLSYDKVEDWHQISAIKVSILLTSIEDCTAKPQPYLLNGEQMMPKDRLLRKWWTYEWHLKNLT